MEQALKEQDVITVEKAVITGEQEGNKPGTSHNNALIMVEQAIITSL